MTLWAPELEAVEAAGAVAAVAVPEFAITGISIDVGAARFRTMDGSDNAHRCTMGPTGAHYGIWGDGGGFGASAGGVIDPGLPNAGVNVRAAQGLGRWYGHLNRSTLSGWKNAAQAGAPAPPGDNVSSSSGGGTRNTESSTVMVKGKSWAPFYVGEILYALIAEQPSWETVALSNVEEQSNTSLYKSTDHGRVWTKVSAVAWNLQLAALNYAWAWPAVAVAGQCHRARPDEYVYFISRGTPHEYTGGGTPVSHYQSNDMILVRALASDLENMSEWRFLSAVDGSNNPTFDVDPANRISIPSLFGGLKNSQTNGFDYFPSLDAYLVVRSTQTSAARIPTIVTNIEILWSRKPWGPYQLVSTIAPFRPTFTGTLDEADPDRWTFSWSFPFGEQLQPTLQGGAWTLPVIFGYTGAGYYDAMQATTATLNLSLTQGNVGIIDGGARIFQGTAALSHTIAVNVGKGIGNNRAVLANFMLGGNEPSAVTFNGVAMTAVVTAASAPNPFTRARSYILLDAALPASPGVYNLVVTFDTPVGTTDVLYGQVYSCHGVAQVVPTQLSGKAVVANSASDSSLDTLTLPAVQAAAKGALVFTGFSCSDLRGVNLAVDGFILDYADYGGAFTDAFGFGHVREIAATPPPRTVVWQSRNLTSGVVQIAVRMAGLVVILEPAEFGPPPPNQPPVVAIPLADQSATVGSPFSYQFPIDRFSDPLGDVLTYSATLSSGAALPGWLTFTPATRTFSGTPASGDVGAITVRVRATDPGGLFAEDDFALTVAAAVANAEHVATATPYVATGNSLTHTMSFAVAATGPKRKLIVGICGSNATPSTLTSVTYNGVAVTEAVAGIGGTSRAGYFFYLDDANLPTDGLAHNLVATFNVSQQAIIGAVEYRNFPQGAPDVVGSVNGTTSGSLTLAGATADGVNIDVATNNASASSTPGADQTERLDQAGTPSTITLAMSDKIAIGTMTAMSASFGTGGTSYLAAHWAKP